MVCDIYTDNRAPGVDYLGCPQLELLGCPGTGW